MKIAIIGTGYVGLVTGISLALLGHKVICVDSDKSKIESIKKGISPIYEKNIDKLLKKVLKKKLFDATDFLEEAIKKSEIIILAVGTPTIDKKIDLSYIKKASKQIGLSLSKTKNYKVIAVKSTVLPGVTRDTVSFVLEKYSNKKAGLDFGLCMNPEFLREGSALEDALHPDRIVIGQIDDKSGKTYAKIYAGINVPVIHTNLHTAEMIKYTANSLLATLISFSNEIARISESTKGVDVLDVWKGVHLDRRLSPFKGKSRIKPGILSYIFSGCGFGGSCFPKDVQALETFATSVGQDAPLIKSVLNINRTQPHRIILLLKKALGKNLKNKKISILGLSFKPDTDDIRESPAFPIIEELILERAKVSAHDPMVYKNNIPDRLSQLEITLTRSINEAVDNADAVILITSWREYIKLTPHFFKKHMKNPVVIDGRRIYNKNAFSDAGIIYKGIGFNIN